MVGKMDGPEKKTSDDDLRLSFVSVPIERAVSRAPNAPTLPASCTRLGWIRRGFRVGGPEIRAGTTVPYELRVKATWQQR